MVELFIHGPPPPQTFRFIIIKQRGNFTSLCSIRWRGFPRSVTLTTRVAGLPTQVDGRRRFSFFVSGRVVRLDGEVAACLYSM
jgi:hypothetical protein